MLRSHLNNTGIHQMKFVIVRDAEQGASIFWGRKYSPKTTAGCTTKAQLARRIASVKAANVADWFVADFDSVGDAIDALNQANNAMAKTDYIPTSV